MALSHLEDCISDDEVFFGELSLKEVKTHILNKRRETIPCIITDDDISNEDQCDESIQIIEPHSEPDIISSRNDSCSVSESPVTSKAETNFNLSPNRSVASWDNKTSDDSFLKIEKMVAELEMSSKNQHGNKELDNTLEVVEYILNNAPAHKIEHNGYNILDQQQKSIPEVEEQRPNKEQETNIFNQVQIASINENTSNVQQCYTPLKKAQKQNCKLIDSSGLPSYLTPVKCDVEQLKSFATPCEIKPKTPNFKTPVNPVSLKKSSVTSLKKTPNKINAYQHISSPIASYIKNCPQVPLLKNIRPKKPLPCPSSIPKLVKTSNKEMGNKENIDLPSVAYRSAKKTKVIDMPDEKKLPQSQWAKQITSLPRPVVMKHEHREMKSTKKPVVPQEDSFANLSFHQADVSVCTKKFAYNKPKNPV